MRLPFRDTGSLSCRCGRFAVVVTYYPAGCGWDLIKWSYGNRSSWWHGTAYLGRFRIVW